MTALLLASPSGSGRSATLRGASQLSVASHGFSDETMWNFLHARRCRCVRAHRIGNRAREVLLMHRRRRVIVLLVLTALVAVAAWVSGRSRSAAAVGAPQPAPFGPIGWWKP